MSKKNEKRKRNLNREQRHAKEALFAMAAALVFLILGMIGLINNRNYLKEYNNSEDIRKVTAIITDAKLQSDKADGRLWFVHLKYDVEGTEYRDTAVLNMNQAVIGGSAAVEVYKRPNGEYVVPEITNSFSLALDNVTAYISIVVGAVLMAAGVFGFVTAWRRIKEIRARIQPDSTD